MSKASSEVELKFELTSLEAARLKEHAVFRSGTNQEPSAETLVSVYYDTPDYRLRNSGISLRLRKKKSRTVQTLKALNGSAGLLRRAELETPTDENTPDVGKLRKMTDDDGMIDTGQLKPVFETRVTRTEARVERDGLVAEIALDEGEVSRGRESAPVCELELELKRGDAQALFALARDLGTHVPLRLGHLSKAERGYELVCGAHRSEKSKDIHLYPRLTTGEALQVIGRNCLRQILANEAGARNGNPDAVHQMRIGIRRLRSAMSLFADVVPDEQTRRLRADLKWLGNQLGAARDAHVFVAEVLEPMKAQSFEGTGLDELSAEFEARRLKAERHASRVLSSQRYRDVMLVTAEWIDAGEWLSNDDPIVATTRKERVKSYAADELSRRRKKLIKRSRKLAKLDAPARHKVRIQAKKLRYATEFLGSLYTSKKRQQRCAEALHALKGVQDALGELNDIATRETMMRDVVSGKRHGEGDKADRAFAAGVVFAAQDSRNESLLEQAVQAANDFADLEPYWK